VAEHRVSSGTKRLTDNYMHSLRREKLYPKNGHGFAPTAQPMKALSTRNIEPGHRSILRRRVGRSYVGT
jgi:hypothetical protein